MTGFAPFLPYGHQSIDDDDIDAVVEVLRGDMLTSGPAVDAFEAAFTNLTDARHAVACANGTAGLHMAVRALGLGPGDKIVVPTLTFLATANAAVYEGAEVVFADVDPDSALLTPHTLEQALRRGGPSVKAVFPVHMAGQPADMAGISEVARAHDLKVVEDSCHAIGGTYDTKAGEAVSIGACLHSDMSVFSLHPVKTVTMGEGGVVTTNDDALTHRLRLARNHGMVRDPALFANADLAFAPSGDANPWYYEMAAPGYNYRACDIQCALGRSQLTKLDHFVTRRRELVARYDELFAAAGCEYLRPLARRAGCQPGWHLYVVLIDFAVIARDRAQVMNALRERGIGCQVHYLPVHLQPYYRNQQPDLDLPGAWNYYQRCLSLPLFPAMTDQDVDRVVETLVDVLNGGGA